MTFDADEFAELLPDVYALNGDRLFAWIREHVEGPRDGMAFIITAAQLIAHALTESNPTVPKVLPPDAYYALEFEFEKPPDNVARNTGQLVAAALNHDDAMLSDLAAAVAWHHDEAVSAGVIVNLVSALSSALHRLADGPAPAVD